MFKKYGFFSAILISCFCFSVACQKQTSLEPDPEIPDPLIIEEDQPVTDFDGNVYQTIKIGDQIWMAENLKSTHYSNGTPIQCFCYNNDTANVRTYGRLYRWADATTNPSSPKSNIGFIQGAAPVGWHIPSNAEWQRLIDYLGGNTTAGGKLKATGTDFWLSPNTGATNESKFNALPAGFYRVDGLFLSIGERAIFMTATAASAMAIRVRTLRYDSAEILGGDFHPQDAGSVRCVKD